MNEDLNELLNLLINSANPNKAVENVSRLIFALSQVELLPIQTDDVPLVNP